MTDDDDDDDDDYLNDLIFEIIEPEETPEFTRVIYPTGWYSRPLTAEEKARRHWALSRSMRKVKE